MTTTLLAALWTVLIVAGLARFRPAPARVRALVAGASSEGSATRVSRGLIVERLGRWALTKAKLDTRLPADPLIARRAGWAIVGAVVLLPVFPPAALGGGLVGWVLPAFGAARAEKRRLAAIAADLPDVVDLLVLAVGAGFTVHLALEAVSRRGQGPLAVELGRTVNEIALGRRISDALDDLPTRAGEAVRPLVGALVSAERYGAPLVSGLDRLADEVRRDRRRRAEEAARRVPVKLVFPLVTCTLPAFALLTVTPLIAGALRSIHI